MKLLFLFLFLQSCATSQVVSLMHECKKTCPRKHKKVLAEAEITKDGAYIKCACTKK